jgi:hypothetical protein
VRLPQRAPLIAAAVALGVIVAFLLLARPGAGPTPPASPGAATPTVPIATALASESGTD